MLYKYRPLNKFTISLIKSGSLWFSNLDALNDPFEGDYYCSNDLIVSQSKEGPFSDGPDSYARVARYLSEDRASLRRQFYVLSLSQIHNDILMWSHYADEHKGVVVGMEVSEDVQFQRDEKQVNPIAVKNSILHRVNYSGDPVSYNPAKNGDDYAEVIVSKTPQWAYEQEVRVIIRDQDYRRKGMGVSVNPDVIKIVYFGMRCTPTQIDETINEIGQVGIKYKRMCMKHGYFSLIAVGA